MKRISIIALILFFLYSFQQISAQSVGINNDESAPEPSAMLDIKSADKGILIPRTDTATVNAAGIPASGLMIYSPADNRFYFYNGSQWTSFDQTLTDSDKDTKIEVEQTPDADNIKFSIAGDEAFTMENGAAAYSLINTEENDGNLFFGYNAGLNSGVGAGGNEGKFNTAIGYQALTTNTFGQGNTAMGFLSLSSNSTGIRNTAIGTDALRFNQSGTQNVAIGWAALQKNKIGVNNAALGYAALFRSNGQNTVSLGFHSGLFDTLSMRNVFLGSLAGAGGSSSADVHTKTENVMLGYYSGRLSQGSHNVFLGAFSGENESGNHKLYIENTNADSTQALVYGEFDQDRIRLNGKVIMRDGWSDIDGDTKIELEKTADADNIRFSIAGDKVFRIENGAAAYSLINSENNGGNLFLGFNAGINTGLGANSGSEGQFNTGIGRLTLNANTTGNQNTANGNAALFKNTSGYGNTAIGSSSLQDNDTGNENTSVGTNALRQNSIGFQNSALGFQAGRLATGSGNVFLGAFSGENEVGNNKLYIENSSADENNALIYGEFDNDLLRVNGELNIDNKYSLTQSTGLIDDVLAYDGFGQTYWREVVSSQWGNIGDDIFFDEGNVGIGESNPQNRLHVVGNDDGNFMAKIENKNTSAKSSGLIIECGPNSKPRDSNIYVSFQDQLGGNIGSITGDGSGGLIYNTTSDRRLKQNIKTFDSGLNMIEKMKARTYEMKANPGVQHIGFIAQELYEVFPNIVKGTPETSSEKKPMMVDYGRLTPVLVAAVKELKAKNEALQKEVAALKEVNRRMDSIEQQFAKLKLENSKPSQASAK